MEPAQSERQKRILSALRADPGAYHHTEHYAYAGRCSLAEAIVELMRLERAGLAGRGRGYAGMTWRLAP